MASVNKVILVGNLGRDASDHVYPWSEAGFSGRIYSVGAVRLLRHIQPLLRGERAEAVMREFAMRLKPFFFAVGLRTPRQVDLTPAALRALFGNRDHILRLLEQFLFSLPPSYAGLRAATLRQRLGALAQRVGRVINRRRALDQSRACEALYSMLRFRHLRPASAALINLH